MTTFDFDKFDAEIAEVLRDCGTGEAPQYLQPETTGEEVPEVVNSIRPARIQSQLAKVAFAKLL